MDNRGLFIRSHNGTIAVRIENRGLRSKTYPNITQASTDRLEYICDHHCTYTGILVYTFGITVMFRYEE